VNNQKNLVDELMTEQPAQSKTLCNPGSGGCFVNRHFLANASVQYQP
jgi:hypothetical protein